MAYMIGDEGPYPNLPDEYCGNCDRETYERGSGLLGMFWGKRAGCPRPSATMTTAQLEAEGIVGMYLIVAIPIDDLMRIRPETRKVPTPPTLTEPVASEGETDEQA